MRENSIIHSAFNLRKLDIFKVIDERIKTLEKNHLDKYIHIEYEKMFLSIVSLYCQTKQKSERDLLKEIYEKNKNQISVNVLFHGKFKLLRRLFMAYYGFFVDVIKQPKEESKYARRKTKERLIKSLKKYKSELEQTCSKSSNGKSSNMSTGYQKSPLKCGD